METGVLAEELTCSVCLGLFQDPVALPCQHSFCARCISDVWNHPGTPNRVSCPQCRRMFKPRPCLVKNHTLQNIVEKYIQSQAATAAVTATGAQSVPVMCEYCIDTPTPAVKTCLKCETSFCSLHLQPHLTKQIYKEHSLIEPIADLTRRQCPSHKKVLEFYCEQDKECVCVSCTIIGSHKSHTLVSLEEARDKLKRELKAEVGKLQTIQNNRTSERQKLKDYESEIKKHSEELKERLSNEFSNWRKQLEEDEKSALKLIDEEENRVLSKIMSFSDSMGEKIEKIQIMDKEAQNQEHKDPFSFVQDVKQLLSRCSKLADDALVSGGTACNSSNNSGYVNRYQINQTARPSQPYYNKIYPGNKIIRIHSQSGYVNPSQTSMQTPRTSLSQDITVNFSRLTSVIQNQMAGYENYQRNITGAINEKSCQLSSLQPSCQM
ncbi:E3 ubiquitin/ISG15 ligase TRIM25-like isoform X1 [Pristis pectinata]|uniref:E3 ubiquitin/ISG15 ligase TRIM25-like isoform X1 n=1 Tax=Pristis pectinata TaxID=685728 RepID=UPI00223C99B2|nr:E3 ubiquitin/ISG15 ligase TRIM25-like isoform X1 [Pristis pectinata]